MVRTVRSPARRAAGWRCGLPFLLCIGLQSGCLAADHLAAPLVGSWRLISYTDTIAGDAPTRSFGVDPVGLFIFTSDGHVSISIMRNPPDISAPTTDPDPDACIPVWFCAYFGTYDVDYHAGTWVTHVRGGNVPAYLGTDQRRHFSIRGDRLVISESYETHGKAVYAERVLVRESGERH
jgi:lipocalin-like protein